MTDELNTLPERRETNSDEELPNGTDSSRGTDDKSLADQQFPELADLEEEIKRRIQSNQRFLDRFMDDDFADEDSFGEDDEDDQNSNEEL